MTKIFKRKILKVPKVDLQVDPGTEFKGAFKKQFEKLTKLFVKVRGRHRSQSAIEAKNGIIGKILNTKMLSDEIINGVESKDWVKLVPQVVKLVNHEYVHKPYVSNGNDKEKVDKYSQYVLPVGTKVRVKLDNPVGYLEGERLHGGFRQGDIRWSKSFHTVTQFYLTPGDPIMYQLDDNKKVAYTKYQLQVVDDNEKQPNNVSGKAYAQEITGKRTVKGKVGYEVRWEDNTKTWELFADIKDDLKDMIKEYNKKDK